MSCNASLGSESLVGYMTAGALAKEHQVTMIASPPAEIPPGVEWVPCDAQPANFNEVGSCLAAVRVATVAARPAAVLAAQL